MLGAFIAKRKTGSAQAAGQATDRLGGLLYLWDQYFVMRPSAGGASGASSEEWFFQ